MNGARIQEHQGGQVIPWTVEVLEPYFYTYRVDYILFLSLDSADRDANAILIIHSLLVPIPV